MADEHKSDITALTVQLLSAFVSKNAMPSEGLPDLIKATRSALTEDLSPASSISARQEYVPAVSVRKSLASSEHIISLIDGKPYKTLKRHLSTHKLTPQQYRERYNLPQSYPLVAPAYSEARRAVAQRLGLGRKRAQMAGESDVLSTAQAKPSVKEAAASPVSGKAVAKSSIKKPVSAKAAEPKLAAGNAATADSHAGAFAVAVPRKRLGIAAVQGDKPAPSGAEKTVSAGTTATKTKAARTRKVKSAGAKSGSKATAKAPGSAATASDTSVAGAGMPSPAPATPSSQT